LIIFFFLLLPIYEPENQSFQEDMVFSYKNCSDLL
jgi:hypothetical protein